MIDHPLIRTTATTNLVVGGLSKYTNYSVSVLGFTQAGDGLLSSSIFCRTKEDCTFIGAENSKTSQPYIHFITFPYFTVPGPPAAIKAIISNASSLTVSWRTPTNDQINGQLTKYTAYILWQTTLEGNNHVQTKTVPPEITKLEVLLLSSTLH